jgi:hypothetical protein
MDLKWRLRLSLNSRRVSWNIFKIKRDMKPLKMAQAQIKESTSAWYM